MFQFLATNEDLNQNAIISLSQVIRRKQSAGLDSVD
jgi:hypothetical protein